MSALRPYPLYLLVNAVFGLGFMLYATVSSVYRFQTVGLGPLELVLVGTVLELSILLCEVPTGVFADTYGRKPSVVAGFLLVGSGFALEGAVPTFAAVLVAQAVWGAGYTFVSGALQAWIADEAPERDLGRTYLRGEQADYAGSLLGVLAGGLLATLALNVPLLLGGALTVALGAVLIPVMRERNFAPAAPPAPRAGRSSLRRMGETAGGGLRLVRARPALLTIFAVMVFFGLSGEGFDRLWEAHLLANIGLPGLGGLDPVAWFGAINAGTLILSYGASEIIARRIDPDGAAGAARLLLVLNACAVAGVLVFALAGSFAVALGAFWFASLARKLVYPVYLAWLNRGLEPGVRATVISASSGANSAGELVGGPPIGAVGALFGLRAALAAAALLLSPALLLYARAARLRDPEKLP